MLAHVYDHSRDLPQWISRWTKDQLQDIPENRCDGIQPVAFHVLGQFNKIEKPGILRGSCNFAKAYRRPARLLKVAKKSLYRTMQRWKVQAGDKIAFQQAFALVVRSAK